MKKISIILLLCGSLFVTAFTAQPQQDAGCFTPQVVVTPAEVSLGESVTLTGTVSNHCSGPKRVNFEISVESPCDGYHSLLYQFNVVVPGNGTYTQSIPYTPNCAGTWDAYNAFLYKNTFAVEVEEEFLVH